MAKNKNTKNDTVKIDTVKNVRPVIKKAIVNLDRKAFEIIYNVTSDTVSIKEV